MKFRRAATFFLALVISSGWLIPSVTRDSVAYGQTLGQGYSVAGDFKGAGYQQIATLYDPNDNLGLRIVVLDRTTTDPKMVSTQWFLEAIDAQIDLVIAITEGIPIADMLKVAAVLETAATTLVGPNGPGAITPGQSKVGIMPAENFSPGGVGFVSRSGTLTYEIADLLTRAGLGQSTCIGVGGDPVVGLPTPDAVRLLNEDPETEAIVIVGEIGGAAEERAAEYMRAEGKKPAVAFIAGRSAPPGKRMGHAGAIVSGNQGTAESKVRAFEEAGIPVANAPSEIPGLVKKALRR